MVEKIWTSYKEAMESGGLGPYGFFDVVKGHTLRRNPENAVLEQDDWVSVLQRCGAQQKFIRRIMDPLWKDWRLRGSAKEWMKLNLEDRWSFLKTLDTVIQKPEQGRESRTSILDDSGQLVTVPVGPRTSSKGRTSISTSDSQGLAQPSSSKEPPKGKFKSTARPSVETKVQEPPLAMDGHKALYKGGERGRLETINIKDAKLNLGGRILSTPPGDFDGKTRGLYLTTQRTVAWQYAQWNAKVDGTAEGGPKIAILKIFVPSEVLAGNSTIVGSEWRSFVWSNRHGQKPAEDLLYLRQRRWLVGPICAQSQDVVDKLEKSAELVPWELEHNEAATQWFTADEDVIQELDEKCAGKVWITDVGLWYSATLAAT